MFSMRYGCLLILRQGHVDILEWPELNMVLVEEENQGLPSNRAV